MSLICQEFFRVESFLRNLNICFLFSGSHLFLGFVTIQLIPVENFLVLCGDGVALFLLIPRSGFGISLFFGLGCFSGFVGLRGWFFCLICYVGVCWVGWDEDEEACWLVAFLRACSVSLFYTVAKSAETTSN
jgi:hypothetical protein